MTVPLATRLERRLRRDEASGCIVWTGANNSKGYGRLRIGGRLIGAHRVAYELARGPIPDGLVIDHLCRNPACCNPEHLEPVTQAENTRRGNSGLRQASRTHCPKGHPYDEANTYRAPNGDRHCRTCISARDRKTAWEKRKDMTNAKRRAKYAESAAGDASHLTASETPCKSEKK